MRLKSLDLIGVICWAVLNVGWAQLPSRPLILGLILGVPLIFVLPGYALAQCLFHKRLPDQPSDFPRSSVLQARLQIDQPISAVDQIIFSLGLSMAIDVLVGFALNILPIGLQAQSWTLSLGIVTTVFALLAVYLRRKDIS